MKYSKTRRLKTILIILAAIIGGVVFLIPYYQQYRTRQRFEEINSNLQHLIDEGQAKSDSAKALIEKTQAEKKDQVEKSSD